MSEPVVCPVCETPNDPESTNCEVCGERLTPPEPGEELAPEENVAATIAEEGESTAAEVVEEEGLDQELDQSDEGELAAELGHEASEPVVDAAPEVLYSPLDGTAYPAGTDEYEEGFGPNGEELVAHPPEDLADDLADDQFDDDLADDQFADEEAELGGFEDGSGTDFDQALDDHAHDEFEEAPADQTSEQFKQLFQPRQKSGAAAEPLPEPGVHAQPATLTVYVNREPVHTHAIETDETLIGRRDPVSDAYPDVDLTEVDEASVVSRKHAYIFRQNRNYTLYVVSNAGTQVNADLLELGQRRPLEDGDVIVLAGSIAMKFDLPD